jgi:hypothetical protein
MPRKKRRRGNGIAVTIGLLACASVVWQASHSAFSGTTSNSNNQMSTGTVSITDSDSGSAMITATNLLPGGPAQTACIGVQYTGSISPSAIKVYATSALESNAGGAYVAWANNAVSELDDNLNLTIEVNTTDMTSAPTSLTDCTPAGYTAYTATPVLAGTTGSLKSFINSNTNFATGLASQWGTVTTTKWRVFRFTYSLAAAAPDTVQGDGVQFSVVWEAQT